jgi:antitoxin MazE
MGCATEMRKRLVKHGNSRALVIDKTILELLGVSDETEFDVTLDSGAVVAKPILVSDERAARLDEAMQRSFEKYSGLYRRLAE